jgi:hypothetical protein
MLKVYMQAAQYFACESLGADITNVRRDVVHVAIARAELSVIITSPAANPPTRKECAGVIAPFPVPLAPRR